MYLLIFLIVYFFFVFFLRSYLCLRNTNINPLTFKKSDDAHGFNGKVFMAICIVELVVVSVYAFKKSLYAYTLPFWYLEHPVLFNIGWILLPTSLLLVWIAQSQMAESWRIGIDKVHKSKLITHGMFSVSRNPIFLAIMIANLGLFLIIPNAFTLLIVSLSTISINTQIRLEEEFLKICHGTDYQEYKNEVRRWL